MKRSTLTPIPTPLRQRWQDARLRLLPGAIFCAAVAAIALLWRDHVASPTLLGQAEAVVASVNCPKPGVLTELAVTRFQKVKAGDPVARIIVAEPQVLASSLAVIQSEIELLRVNLRPIASQQRAAINYTQLRLDWMKERAQLASAQVNLQLAETEYQRTEDLFKSKVSSQQALDQAVAMRDSLRGEVAELKKLVTDGERYMADLQVSNSTEVVQVSEAPIRAAIAVQESKLRLTEAELSPILLKAPIEGIVTTLYYQPGEAVTAGRPIVGIVSYEPIRIVGYLRLPVPREPRAAMRVEVRTRGWHRQVGEARVVEVGAQLETIPAALLGSLRFGAAELGLPLNISLPSNLAIRPGEVVDLMLDYSAN